MDINSILKKHNESIEEYLPDKTVKDILKFVDDMRDRLGDFGYGNTTFHTADIQLLLIIVEEAVKEDLRRTKT